jgi:phosphoserine phosphatase RsbU/P
LPAGLFADADFTGATAQLHPGDYMVIYTDGVTEATNTTAELFGDEGLRKVLQEFNGSNVEELSSAIRSGGQTCTGGAPQSDDITLVVIQFLGKQPN